MKTTTPLTIALAVAALMVPAAAQAQPADMHASTAVAAAKARENVKQDLRSPDARDAAAHPRGYVAPINARGATAADSQSVIPAPALQQAPTWPTDPKPVTSAPASQPATGTSGDGVDWTTVLIGIAGSLLAVGGLALIANRRRPPRLGASV